MKDLLITYLTQSGSTSSGRIFEQGLPIIVVDMPHAITNRDLLTQLVSTNHNDIQDDIRDAFC